MRQNPLVAFVNESTVYPDSDLPGLVEALQHQVAYHFRPYWGRGAHCEVVPRGTVPPTGSWVVAILDNSDQAGALGYHDVTSDGTPLAKVFAATDKQYGLNVSVTASHELLEMLGDPEINQACQAANGDFWALEVGDPVESDSDGYIIHATKAGVDVLVSDFITPAWFGTGSGRYDYRGRLTKPHQLRPGGYASVWTGVGGWTQHTADGAPAPAPDPDDHRNRILRRPSAA